MSKYTITMLGEKDHGKSTLIANLMIALGQVSKDKMSDAKREASKKSSRFEPAFILDSFSEEKEQEMTIDTTRIDLVYKGHILELIDVPGHLELIKNMMSGASNADLAVAVISAKMGERLKPQTKRHIFIADMFGIETIIWAINKMDSVNYDMAIFNKIKLELENYLKDIGFKGTSYFVPISAYNNENMLIKSKNMKWYKGKSLIDIVSLSLKKRQQRPKQNRGLRALVQDISKDNGKEVAFCIVYKGRITKAQRIYIQPNGKAAKVLEIYVKGKKTSSVSEGSNAALTITPQGRAKRGDVIRDVLTQLKKQFQTRLLFIKDIDPKAKGMEIKINNNDIAIKSIKVIRIINLQNRKQSSNIIGVNTPIIASVELEKSYPVEKFSCLRELGRFGLYQNDKFIGVGIVE